MCLYIWIDVCVSVFYPEMLATHHSLWVSCMRVSRLYFVLFCSVLGNRIDDDFIRIYSAHPPLYIHTHSHARTHARTQFHHLNLNLMLLAIRRISTFIHTYAHWINKFRLEIGFGTITENLRKICINNTMKFVWENIICIELLVVSTNAAKKNETKRNENNEIRMRTFGVTFHISRSLCIDSTICAYIYIYFSHHHHNLRLVLCGCVLHIFISMPIHFNEREKTICMLEFGIFIRILILILILRDTYRKHPKLWCWLEKFYRNTQASQCNRLLLPLMLMLIVYLKSVDQSTFYYSCSSHALHNHISASWVHASKTIIIIYDLTTRTAHVGIYFFFFSCFRFAMMVLSELVMRKKYANQAELEQRLGRASERNKKKIT